MSNLAKLWSNEKNFARELQYLTRLESLIGSESDPPHERLADTLIKLAIVTIRSGGDLEDAREWCARATKLFETETFAAELLLAGRLAQIHHKLWYALHSRLPHILWLADPPTAHVLYHL